MKLDIRYSNHPEDVKKYTTEELRNHFLIKDVFQADEVLLTYSHNDRIIAGGIMPVSTTLSLSGGKNLGVENFFDRREAGIINIGGKGIVTIDNVAYELNQNDGLYVGLGVKNITFESSVLETPAKFYINSCPAHTHYPHVHITLDKAQKVSLGSEETLNKRVINQYVHPNVCKSCQLVMGMTFLEPHNVWNTMPAHTHERRMEVYFYFNMDEQTRLFHLMGEKDETRHLVMSNEQAVISPSWSIHSGVGTSNYTFIWGMCGENQEFTDMDHISMNELR